MKLFAHLSVCSVTLVALAAFAPDAFAQVVATSPPAARPPPTAPWMTPAPRDCTPRVIGGHNYFFCPVALEHDRAREFCHSFGTELASLANRYENDAVAEVVRTLGRGRHVIGYTDRQTEGRFVSDDGSPTTFTGWAVGEPNNINDEDCVELDGSSMWNDIPCANSPGNVLCEETSPCTAEVFGDHVYQFCRRAGDARQWCRSIGSHLASIDSDAERGFVEEHGGSVGLGLCPASGAARGDAFVCESEEPCVRRFHDGRMYLFCTRAGATPNVARARCRAMGATLASIEDATENDFVYSNFALFRRSHFYIGLTDDDAEGSFHYADGRPATFTRWASGEPNNSADEDCVELADQGWNDIPCDRIPLGAFVCEMPPR